MTSVNQLRQMVRLQTIRTERQLQQLNEARQQAQQAQQAVEVAAVGLQDAHERKQRLIKTTRDGQTGTVPMSPQQVLDAMSLVASSELRVIQAEEGIRAARSELEQKEAQVDRLRCQWQQQTQREARWVQQRTNAVTQERLAQDDHEEDDLAEDIVLVRLKPGGAGHADS